MATLHTRYFQRTLSGPDNANDPQFRLIAGHGGNACLELVAALVNALRDVLADSVGDRPTLEQIEQAFAKTQGIRQARATTLKIHSHEQQRIESLDTRSHKLAAYYLLPMTDVEDVIFNFSRNMPLSEKLTSPKTSSVPRLVPYKDQLLSCLVHRGIRKWCFMRFYLLHSFNTVYGPGLLIRVFEVIRPSTTIWCFSQRLTCQA